MIRFLHRPLITCLFFFASALTVRSMSIDLDTLLTKQLLNMPPELFVATMAYASTIPIPVIILPCTKAVPFDPTECMNKFPDSHTVTAARTIDPDSVEIYLAFSRDPLYIPGEITQPGSLGHTASICHVEATLDLSTIGTASLDTTARLWNDTGRLKFPLRGHKEAVLTIDFNALNNRAVTASNDSTARIWNISNGKCLSILSGHAKSVTSARFDHAGTRIVTISADATGRVWDIRTGACRAILTGHRDRLDVLAIDPTDRFILTGSVDGTACLWDFDGNCLAMFDGHTSPICCGYFCGSQGRSATIASLGQGAFWYELPLQYLLRDFSDRQMLFLAYVTSLESAASPEVNCFFKHLSPDAIKNIFWSFEPAARMGLITHFKILQEDPFFQKCSALWKESPTDHDATDTLHESPDMTHAPSPTPQ